MVGRLANGSREKTPGSLPFTDTKDAGCAFDGVICPTGLFGDLAVQPHLKNVLIFRRPKPLLTPPSERLKKAG
jgi:hypothetical protein